MFSRCSNSLMFPYKEYVRTTSPVLLVDGPWGLLDFVLRALWALRLCDPGIFFQNFVPVILTSADL